MWSFVRLCLKMKDVVKFLPVSKKKNQKSSKFDFSTFFLLNCDAAKRQGSNIRCQFLSEGGCIFTGTSKVLLGNGSRSARILLSPMKVYITLNIYPKSSGVSSPQMLHGLIQTPESSSHGSVMSSDDQTPIRLTGY